MYRKANGFAKASKSVIAGLSLISVALLAMAFMMLVSFEDSSDPFEPQAVGMDVSDGNDTVTLYYHPGAGYGENYRIQVEIGQTHQITEPPFLDVPQDKEFLHWRLLTPNQAPGYVEYDTGDTFEITADLIPDAPEPDRYISLVAIWGGFRDVVVTFDTDGGSKVNSIVGKHGEVLHSPVNPVKSGYDFLGWSPSLPTHFPIESTTYTAIWGHIVPLYYHTGMGYGEDYVRTVKTGEMYTIIEPPFLSGPQDKEFLHWRLLTPNQAPGYVVYNTGDTFEITEDLIPDAPASDRYISLVAIWGEPKDIVISFNTDGGSEIESIVGKYGDLVQAPANPTKDGAAFVRWSPALPEYFPMENKTYTAIWTTDVVSITFDTDGGSEVPTAYYIPDQKVVSPEPPTKEGYTFRGWSPALPEYMPFEDIVVTAIWELGYQITFCNWDGTELQSSMCLMGELPEYLGETPVREADAQYTYTFRGWDPEVVTVTGPVTYIAVYTLQTNSYEITFVDEAGNVLQSDVLEYGEMPEFRGETPIKEREEHYSYEFIGWDPVIDVVTGPATYVTSFEKIPDKYTITWLDSDGSLLLVDREAPYGEKPVYKGQTPTKPSDEKKHHVFSTWTPALTIVTGDATYTAVYRDVPVEYEITFKDYDGTLLYTWVSDYGSFPAYFGESLKDKTISIDGHLYKYVGWSPDLKAITCDATYTAKYEPIGYEITFKDWNGEVLETQNVKPGMVPVYSGGVPIRAETVQYTYAFAGWAPTIVEVTEDAIYTATYAEGLRKYSVTFMVGDDVFSESSFAYGSNIVAPADAPSLPDSHGYKFNFMGWDGLEDDMTIQKDMVFAATFVPEPTSYPDVVDKEVIFEVDADTIILSEAIIDETHSKFEAGEIERLLIKLDGGSITFDKNAFFVFRSGDVSLSMDLLDLSDIPAVIAQTVHGCPVYDISIGDHHNFGNGQLTLCIDFAITDDIVRDSVRVLHFKDNGDFETVDFVYENGKITFATSSLSYFAIVYEAPADSGDTDDDASDDDHTIMIVTIAACAVCAVGAIVLVLRRRL